MCYDSALCSLRALDGMRNDVEAGQMEVGREWIAVLL